MADIFVSYSSSDRETVAVLTGALKQSGFDVWWDRQLSPGNRFTDEMELELEAAGAVLVVWSASSVKSMWVADEASVGRDKGNLVPICIEPVLPAMGFRQLHAIDFQHWRGDSGSSEFCQLKDSLHKVIAGRRADYIHDQPGSKVVKTRPQAGKRAALVVSTLLAMVLALWFFLPEATQPQPADTDSGENVIADSAAVGLAVIPFASLSPRPEQALFADGLSEELLSRLGHVEGLKVPGRSSAFRFKGKNEDLRVIGQQLNVDYVLEGSVRKSGTDLRISAQLSETADGRLIWSESFDRQLNDLFQVQDEIAETVARELLGKLPDTGAGNPAYIGEVDPAAHQLYLQGRALWSRRQQAALEKFKQAIAIDPDHWLAQAYVAIVGAVAETGTQSSGQDAEALRTTTNQALAKAVQLRPEAADVLFAQGWVIEMRHQFIDGQLKDPMVIDFMQRAVRANPRHLEALHALARMDLPEARRIELLETIIAIDPGHARAWFNLIGAYIQAGEASKAREMAPNMLISAPDMPLRIAAALAKRVGDIELLGTILFKDWEATDGDHRGRIRRAALLADLGALAEAEYLYREGVARSLPSPATDRVLAEILADNQPARLAAARAMYDYSSSQDEARLMLAAAYLATDQPQAAWDLISAERPDLRSTAATFRAQGLLTLGDPYLYVAAEALDFLGRHDEAARLWSLALESSTGSQGGTWLAPLNRALLHARLGHTELAAASFNEAYEAGFRFIYSFPCEACVHDGFSADHGMFSPLLEIPEAAELVEQIKLDNRRLLDRLNERFGIVDHVHQQMTAGKQPR